MSNTNQVRQQFHDAYKIILNRNLYNQSFRQYVYTPLKGNYYSDCSSSICAAMNKIGIAMGLLNTAGMYRSPLWTEIPLSIINGHIAASDIGKLRVGDALLFRGNDPSRPLQIGHVEAIYEINGTREEDIVLCGHGSGRPSLKNMHKYLTARQAGKAPNGKNRGLVCLLRAIPDNNTPQNDSTYTHQNFVREVQASIGAVQDGIAGPETLLKTITVSSKKNSRHAVVLPIQKYLLTLDHPCGAPDGIAGSKFHNAITNYQLQNGCIADGEITAGMLTWKKLLRLN